jgi:hypothetical protein
MPIDLAEPTFRQRLSRVHPTCIKADNVSVLGVKYVHLRFLDGDELYLTAAGIPYLEMLVPDSVWTDKEYLPRHSERLRGTSTVYRITPKNSLLGKQIVLKWNRMGQDVPGETRLLFPSAFNSPFEEFQLVQELRQTALARSGRLCPHKPLAIYIPHELSQPWQLGRKDYLMPVHEDVSLDKSRSYAVIYEWMRGRDLIEAQDEGLLNAEDVDRMTNQVDELLAEEGYVVADRKPQHIIVRRNRQGVRILRSGQPLMGLIDFELLKRTPGFDRLRRARKRKEYLERQAHRFDVNVAAMPRTLHRTNILGVDYVYGDVEGTDAQLWVVGNDPALFDYFRPEKWRRTPRTKLSNATQTYHTLTKDDINIVWKVSKVGEIVCVDPLSPGNKMILDHGYNSPFEEIKIAQDMSRKGIRAIYPRAIYMTGHRSQMLSILADERRYKSHAEIKTPDGHPILRKDRDYITIWGYWNGLDQDLCADDNHHLTPISAFLAYHHKFISEEAYIGLLKREGDRLKQAGFQDLNFKGSHLLMSLDADRRIMADADGRPMTRVCNFELVRELG